MKIEKIKNILLDKFQDSEAIYIFGSLYDGSFNNSSDIDIAILYKLPLNSLERYKFQEDLSIIFKRDVDLIDLQKVSDVFAYHIINNSLKIKTSKFANNYEMRIWYRYLDLQDDRKIILEEFYG